MSLQKEPEEGQETISLPQYLGHAMAALEYQELPNSGEEIWYLQQPVREDGKKFSFATLTIMGVNTVFTNWYDEERLALHVQQATNALMRVRAQNAASGKLVTASSADLQRIVELARINDPKNFKE
jgi:hypothetical protein